MKIKIKSELLKSVLGVGVLRLVSLPAGLAVSIILARLLGPEEFGQYAFVMALIPILSLPVSGGLQRLLTREVAVFTHTKTWGLYKGVIRIAHIWVLGVSTLVLLGFWSIKKTVSIFDGDPRWEVLGIALLLVPLVGLSEIRVGTIKGLGYPAYAETPSQFIQPVLRVVALAVLYWLDLTFLSAVVWSEVLVSSAVCGVAIWMFIAVQPREAKGVEWTHDVERWKRALWPFSLIALVATFNSQIGIVVLGFFSSDDQVAAMRVAERGGQLVAMALTLVNMVIAPYIVRAYRDRDISALQKLARQSARGCFALALPVAIILVVAGKWLIEVTFGAEYSELSYWPLVIIVLSQLINVYFGSVGNLLAMSGYERQALKGQVLAIMVNIMVCWALVPQYGVIGAAIGVTLGMLTWNMILYSVVRKRIGIDSRAI